MSGFLIERNARRGKGKSFLLLSLSVIRAVEKSRTPVCRLDKDWVMVSVFSFLGKWNFQSSLVLRLFGREKENIRSLESMFLNQNKRGGYDLVTVGKALLSESFWCSFYKVIKCLKLFKIVLEIKKKYWIMNYYLAIYVKHFDFIVNLCRHFFAISERMF